MEAALESTTVALVEVHCTSHSVLYIFFKNISISLTGNVPRGVKKTRVLFFVFSRWVSALPPCDQKRIGQTHS